ncbi:hypothetical protein I7I51_00679 [Histoplasma capsulatum]|uniref:Uncharacterized protein n=1 Tax=Ajellomyces capsulatus TaxID=5037 RepID=A0A8A1MEN6_AJECA|nr:hypothetical protein I7I51_00679 [Histoplasma capsulatum]
MPTPVGNSSYYRSLQSHAFYSHEEPSRYNNRSFASWTLIKSLRLRYGQVPGENAGASQTELDMMRPQVKLTHSAFIALISVSRCIQLGRNRVDDFEHPPYPLASQTTENSCSNDTCCGGGFHMSINFRDQMESMPEKLKKDSNMTPDRLKEYKIFVGKIQDII